MVSASSSLEQMTLRSVSLSVNLVPTYLFFIHCNYVCHKRRSVTNQVELQSKTGKVYKSKLKYMHQSSQLAVN